MQRLVSRVFSMATAEARAAVERAQHLVWVDCEMTGLDLEKPQADTLVEIATIVTDKDLNIIAEGPELVIHQPDKVLARMNDWCRETFAANGLTERIRTSTVSMRDAELKTLDFVRAHTDSGSCALAGNSVHVDRRFLIRYMPEFDAHLHYRIVDVSTVKELVKRWRPDLPPFEKRGSHRALDDIRESIAEMQYYRKHVFRETSR